MSTKFEREQLVVASLERIAEALERIVQIVEAETLIEKRQEPSGFVIGTHE
jgi:hypothetical protein